MPEQPPAPTLTRRMGALPSFSARALIFWAACGVSETMGLGRLELLGLAAPAGALFLGVADLEARGHRVFAVVDDRFFDQGHAVGIDHDVEAGLGDHVVVRALLVEAEGVLEARAAGRLEHHAQGL